MEIVKGRTGTGVPGLYCLRPTRTVKARTGPAVSNHPSFLTGRLVVSVSPGAVRGRRGRRAPAFIGSAPHDCPHRTPTDRDIICTRPESRYKPRIRTTGSFPPDSPRAK